MNTIQAQWLSYLRDVVPRDAGPVQVEECRRAFYAGAAGLLSITSTVIPYMDEDAGVAVLEGLHQELQGFAVAVGRA